ncbi:MAG TPA: outer membrane protein assembly factor BamE [Noviherbaspirillum sp.]|nr:outer membrane protein assembly factor BamE [Noviherbaspirillum sp.]
MKSLYPAFAVLFFLMLVGCDRHGRFIEEPGLDRLEPGVSREADVRAVFGQPDAIIPGPNGTRIMQYPRGPEGPRTWFFELDSEGILRGYRQVLTPENFSRIRPGMSRDEVRMELGRPGSTTPFPLKNEEVWDWRYLQDNNPQFFSVHFDRTTGQVVRTSTSPANGEVPMR